MANSFKFQTVKVFCFAFALAVIHLPVWAQTKCKEPKTPHQNFAPIVYQTTDYTCGPAAALSLLKSWKLAKQTEMELIKTFKTNTDVGTMPQNFIDGFRRLNVKAEYFEKIDLKKLKELYDAKKALIPLVDSEGDHWILITDFKDKITVMNPWPDDDKCGYQTYTQKEFEKIWHAKIGNQAVIAVTKPEAL